MQKRGKAAEFCWGTITVCCRCGPYMSARVIPRSCDARTLWWPFDEDHMVRVDLSCQPRGLCFDRLIFIDFYFLLFLLFYCFAPTFLQFTPNAIFSSHFTLQLTFKFQFFSQFFFLLLFYHFAPKYHFLSIRCNPRVLVSLNFGIKFLIKFSHV